MTKGELLKYLQPYMDSIELVRITENGELISIQAKYDHVFFNEPNSQGGIVSLILIEDGIVIGKERLMGCPVVPKEASSHAK